MVMLTNRAIMAALLAVAIASSLIAVSGFVGSAYAAKKGKGDSVSNTMSKSNDDSENPETSSNSESPNSDTPNQALDSTTPAPNNGSPSAQDFKSLMNCASGPALDGHLNLAKLRECYGQVFGHGEGMDQSSSMPGVLPNIG
jgi:hypothetical protein